MPGAQGRFPVCLPAFVAKNTSGLSFLGQITLLREKEAKFTIVLGVSLYTGVDGGCDYAYADCESESLRRLRIEIGNRLCARGIPRWPETRQRAALLKHQSRVPGGKN